MRQHFIAVASADHVARGKAQGFMQACHGKRGPLGRMRAGDGIIYYSPGQTMGGPADRKAFTALGFARDRDPYAFDMGGGFVPFRRDVSWCETLDRPIGPLLPHLELTAGRTNWGAPFRFGFVAITKADFETIRAAMTG